MKTTIDLTDDVSPDEPFRMPDPASMFLDGDDVVLQLREVELRMTFPQFLMLSEAMSEWSLRGHRSERDINDERTCPAFEHDRLRKIVRAMLVDGELVDCGFGPAEVPKKLQDAIRYRLHASGDKYEAWRFIVDELGEAKATIEELREELKAAKARRAKRDAKSWPT